MNEDKSASCPSGFDEVEFQAASILTNLANGGFPEGVSSSQKSPQLMRKRKMKVAPVQKTNKVSESFWCNDCKIPGFSKFGLKLHRRRVHGEKPSEQPTPVKMKMETSQPKSRPSSSHSIKILTPLSSGLSLSNCEFLTLQLPVSTIGNGEKKSPTKPGQPPSNSIGNLPLIVQTLWSQSESSSVITNISAVPQKILPKEDDKPENLEKEHTYVKKESQTATAHQSTVNDEFEALPVHKAEDTSKFTKCERCMLPFFTKAGLHHHYKSVHKLNIKPTKDFDWDRFEKMKKVQSKSKVIQPDDKQYACHICGKSFPWKVSLSVHLKVHTGEKPFQCTVCKRSFSERCHLTDHMRLHTGEKPFQCHICSKSYTWRLSLQAHLKVHSGEKPFDCPHCDKTFAQRTNMLKHLETRHTVKEERRVYACPYCDKGYRCNKALKQHLLSHDHSYCISVDEEGTNEEVSS